jgi:cytochrome c biogenesis protein CcmG/thiol:disulfide interchange protein DsbE
MSSTTKQRRHPAPPPAKRSTGTAIVVAIVVAVVVAVGLGVVLLTGDDDGGEDASVPPPTASAPSADDDATPFDVPAEYEGEIRPVTVSGTPLPAYTEDEAVGAIVPTVSGESFDGTPVVIGPSGDGPTMVVLLAHWCPHCNNEVPRLVELHRDGRLPANLRVVGVSTAVNAQRPNFPPSRWLSGEEWPWEVLADGVDPSGSFVAAAAYGLDELPQVMIFDAAGAVIERWSGESDIDELAERIDQAVGA